MNATLLFIHGTGVRGLAYAASLRRIEAQVQRHNLPLRVVGCYWGEAEGARLRAGGASIPGYGEAGGHAPSDADLAIGLWAVLYTDPLYELRLLRYFPKTERASFGQEPPSVRLWRAISAYVPSDELRGAFAMAGLGDGLDTGLTQVRSSAEFMTACETAPADAVEHRRATARAIVAATLDATEGVDGTAVDGGTRDQLVAMLTSELHGEGLGVGEFLLRPVVGLATRWATRHRGSITDYTAPATGDVARFLANGEGARNYVRSAINDVSPGQVYVLGHSLGGIITVDLLVRERLGNVAGLITVGSQSPFLYEIGALPALDHPAPLPDHVPPWLNVYDRRDLLSYVASGLFGDRVHDLEVDNGQPFPQSHSAYWANPVLWQAIGTFVT
jgi:hypothetical protein